MSQGSQPGPSVRRSGPRILYTLVTTSMVAVSTKLFSGGGLRSEVTSKVSRRWMRLRAAAILQRRGRHPNAPKDLSGTCGETAGRSKSLKGFHGLESVIREGV